MAANANEILSAILNVCSKINAKMDDHSSKQSAPDNMASRGAGMTGFKDFEGFDQTKSKNLKSTAEALKEMGSALGILSKGLWKFWLVPAGAKKSLVLFMTEMKIMAAGATAAGAVAFKKLAEGMEILGDALPKLASGVLKFGIISRTGLVTAAVAGLTQLYGVMLMIGNPATAPLVLTAAAAIASIGIALNGIANVMKSIALVVLAFGAAIVTMVGAIWLANKLFGSPGPLKAMGIVVGAIAILAGGFALLGVLSPMILLAGPAIAAMGVGLGLLGIGLVTFVGSIALMNYMMKGESAVDAITGMMKPIVLVSLFFAGLSLIGGMIQKGGIAVAAMGIGMVALAAGVLALGGTSKLLNMMGVDADESFGSIAMGVAKLGLMFAGLGLISLLIIPGIFILMGMAASLVLFGMVTLSIAAIISQLGGEKGLETTTNNIADLIGTVLIGVIKGVSQGLLGVDGDSKNFFGKVGAIGKNVTVLIGSIGLLFGVSLALIMFASSLKAFTSAGVIKTIVGYDPNTGQPIFGDAINVVSAGENIAKSIGSFFKTLTTTFKDPSIIPDKKKVEDIVDILMGRTGFRVLALAKIGTRPGILDAITKFAELISTFANVNQIPVFDSNGKVIGYTEPSKIAANIVASLASFFKAFNDINFSLAFTKQGKNNMTALQSFDTLNEQLKKLIKQKEGLSKTAEILEKVAKSVSKLSISLTDIDSGKLSSLASISAAELKAEINGKESWLERTVNKLSNIGTNNIQVKQEVVQAQTAPFSSIKTPAEVAKAAAIQQQMTEEQWNNIAQNIGAAVAAAIPAALQSVQFKFEFAKENYGTVTFN